MKKNSLTAGIAALATTVLLLTSCGTTAVEITGRARADDPAATPTLVDGAPDDTGATTSAPGDTLESTAPVSDPTTTVAATTERSDAAFCAAAGRVLDSGVNRVLDIDIGDLDPTKALETYQELMRSFDSVIAEMDRTAPPAISDDMHEVAVATAESTRDLQSAESFGDVWGSAKIMGTADTAKATVRVTEYVLEHCGFSIDGHVVD